MKKNILISFSGGRTSAFMATFIKKLPKYNNCNLLYVFANTGKESEATLKFVDDCDKAFDLGVVWIEADVQPTKGKGTKYKIVDYKTASRNGEPFEAVIKKYGLPSKLYRHCTRDLKEVPIHKYAKEIFGGSNYVTAIGIRADEQHRLSIKPNIIYPLAKDIQVDEKFIRNWWSQQNFDLDLKDYEGNCDLCFLKSVRKKKTLISENPSIQDWWQLMEIKYGANNQQLFDVYRNLSIPDLVNLAKQPFNKAIDKKELRDSQQDLFDADDIEFDCFCKNT